MDLLGLTLTEMFLWASIILFVLYKLGTWNHDHFKSRGVKNTKTVPFLGSLSGPFFKRRSFAYLIEDLCKNFKGERIVGMFQFHKPILSINDPELIKQITVKDFDHFMDHAQTATEKSDPLFSKNLFSLRGEKWRDMRTTLSPAFTSSKMRNMFNFMNECGRQLGEYLDNEIKKQEPGKPYVLEMKDLFTRFTNDVIATSAFGIHIDSLKEKDNEFYKMGKEVTDFSGAKAFRFFAVVLAPKLVELLGITLFTKREQAFFRDLIHDTVGTRDKLGIVRPDMIHLLMQARDGNLQADGEKDDEDSIGEHKSKKLKLTLDDIAAQALIFFFAGFDTASALLSFAAILLAMNEDCQRKLQEELDEVLGENHKVTYDNVQKLKYLDMVLSETLRMFPPTMQMDRQCTKTYVIPASGDQPAYTIKNGDQIIIPVYGIHRNPEYYPDPEKFDPERFSEENKANIQPYTYLPFGVGPRLCIGQRFALLEAKVALVYILSRYDLTVVEKTPLPLRISPKTFSMVVEGGFWIGAKPREKITS